LPTIQFDHAVRVSRPRQRFIDRAAGETLSGRLRPDLAEPNLEIFQCRVG
jgi:hypothetical protein